MHIERNELKILTMAHDRMKMKVLIGPHLDFTFSDGFTKE